MDEQFWQAERELLFNLLFPLIQEAALTGAQNAMNDLITTVGVGVDWALVNEAAREWARRYTGELVRGITETSRTFVQQSIADWVDTGQPLDSLTRTLEPMFGRVRAEMIAATEVTRAFAQGNLASWQASGVVEAKRWQVAGDEKTCPICQPLQGQVVPLNGLFDGKFNGPPAHVRCRCWIQPVVVTNG